MTLIEKLKTELRKKGLSEELADIVSITQESEISTIVEKLSGVKATTETVPEVAEFLSSQAISDYIKKNGFDSLLKLNKSIQSEHDKKVAQGIATFKKKLFDGDGGGDDTNPNPNPNTKPNTSDDMPAWAQKLLEKVTSLETKQQVETKSQKAQSAIEKANIPSALKKSWLSRIDLESETPYEDQVKTLEEEYKSIHVGIVGSGTYEFNDTEGGQGGPKQKGKLSDTERAELSAAAKNL